MRLSFVLAAAFLPASAIGQTATGSRVVVGGAPESAPICPSGDDTLALTSAIAQADNPTIVALTSSRGCLWAWDGSSGTVLAQDSRGLVQVDFARLARLPEVRRSGIYWIDGRYLQGALD